MITVPTVLVVGAGGSAHLDMPSGRQLLKLVLSSEITQQLVACRFHEMEVERLQDALRRSGLSSVDAFLERRNEFLKIGKMAIAAALLPAESERKLFDRGQASWYELLWQYLAADQDTFPQNKLTILTFNYDRSLDRFLEEAISNTFNPRPEDQATLNRAVPIHHLHGQLGAMSEVPYGASTHVPSYIAAARGIRVIHEENPDNEQFVAARHAIRQASRIYFVGFGYDPRNTERLGLKSNLGTTQWFGSGYGLSAQEAHSARNRTFHNLEVGNTDHDALRFLRHTSSPMDGPS